MIKGTTNYTNKTNNFAAFAANGTNLCRFAPLRTIVMQPSLTNFWIALILAMTQIKSSVQFVPIRTLASQIIV